jgi:hypothetical protein
MQFLKVDNNMIPNANLNLPVGIDFPIIDQLILSRDEEIENFNNMYKEFQETGMTRIGNTRGIDIENLGQKNKPQFSH